MKSKQIFFYGLEIDLRDILKHIEQNFEVKYIKVGLLDYTPDTIDSFLDTENTIGVSLYKDWNQVDKYMIIPKTEEVEIRNVPQKRGGLKYAIDQMKNPNSIIFYSGGVYNESFIIASKIGTISQTEFSKKIFKSVSSYIKKGFQKEGAFYISDESLKKQKQGVILTTDVG